MRSTLFVAIGAAALLIGAACSGGSDEIAGDAGGPSIEGGAPPADAATPRDAAGAADGRGGMGGAGGTGGATDGTGGATGGTGGTSGPPMGTQPLGSLCANTGNCSQASGMAVCCTNTCTLVEMCPSSPGYLPCSKQLDCDAFGGGKVCCEAGGMRFCTKPSACSGRRLP